MPQERKAVSAVLPVAEARSIESAAQAANMSISTWLRQAAQAALGEVRQSIDRIELDASLLREVDIGARLMSATTGRPWTRRRLIEKAVESELAQMATQGDRADAAGNVALRASSVRSPQSRLMELLRRNSDLGIREAAALTKLDPKDYYRVERGELSPDDDEIWIAWMTAIAGTRPQQEKGSQP